ncbi:L-type lectin-domain containing receptor kinase IV.4 [Linum perenne]
MVILVDWVFPCWHNGGILDAKDPNLDSEFVGEEVELVLKLGSLCSHSDPEFRPNMQQIQLMLKGELPLPNMSSVELSITSIGLGFAGQEALPTRYFHTHLLLSHLLINMSSAEGSLVYTLVYFPLKCNLKRMEN